jgi:hypothetical protein
VHFWEGHRRPSQPASQLAAEKAHTLVKKTTAIADNSLVAMLAMAPVATRI